MKQKPLKQIAIPLESAEEDMHQILEAWGCRFTHQNEDDIYVRRFVVTPRGGNVRLELKKSATESLADFGLSEEEMLQSVYRNLLTLVYNDLVDDGDDPQLPTEILGRGPGRDADRIIDESPQDR